MTQANPLTDQLDELGATWMPYGSMTRVPAVYEAVELEYAPLRKGAGLFDSPHRGLIEATGAERLEFMHRMLTHACDDLVDGQGRMMFLLDEKGRLFAELILLNEGDRTWIDMDIHQAASVAAELDKFVFTEDVKFEDRSASMHRISVLGPKCFELVGAATGKEVAALGPYGHVGADIAGKACRVFRQDAVGDAGLHVWCDNADAAAIWDALMAAGEPMQARPVGWLAFNTARIEVGRPIFNIDYGAGSYPGETGLGPETVSFTKGCYRGQEVVARMEHLGHPAKQLTGFKVIDSDAVPVDGATVFADESMEKPVGQVTSSTFAPLMSQASIGFAMIKWAHRGEGKRLFVETDTSFQQIELMDGLAFIERGAAASGG